MAPPKQLIVAFLVATLLSPAAAFFHASPSRGAVAARRSVVQTNMVVGTKPRIQPAKPVFGTLSKVIVQSYENQVIPLPKKQRQGEGKKEKGDPINDQPNAFARALVRMYQCGW